MAKKIYEIEIQRRNISPRSFFTYCDKQMKKKCGVGLDCWLDDYDDWARESNGYNTRTEDEICKCLPYDVQMFARDGYNFIMEFQFDDDKKGYGYLYAVEFER